MIRWLTAAVLAAGLYSGTAIADDVGIPVTIRVEDPEGNPIRTAVVRHPLEADRLRVNAETGEWTGSVLYLPDGSELIFEKDSELQFEISAPGFQNFNLAYKVRKRKNVVPVTLYPMDMTDINDEEDEEVIIGFGRDRPIER